MSFPASLNKNLALPVICAPMFIISNSDLVIAQCRGGLIGRLAALNAAKTVARYDLFRQQCRGGSGEIGLFQQAHPRVYDLALAVDE